MISKLFLLAVKLCLSASIVTGVVLLLRPVLKKAPKGLGCALWALVALRLLIPVLPESRVSVIPEAVSGGKAVEALMSQAVEETLTVREDLQPALYQEITVKYRDLPVYQEAGQNYVVVSASPVHTPPKTFGESVVPGLSVVWIIGIGIMLVYMIGSSLNLHRRLRTAVIREKGVWESDEITSPFILGVIRPRIYLPTSLTEEERTFVLDHEKTHLKRGDQVWKPLGYLLLSVYWFNPLFWLAYFLVCRDIEGACDERVIKNEGPAYRKAYSETLLKLNIRQKAVAVCPLAFSENGVGGRIRSVLNYKKPAFWLIAAALVVSIVAAGCALTDPEKKSRGPEDNSAVKEMVANKTFYLDKADAAGGGRDFWVSFSDEGWFNCCESDLRESFGQGRWEIDGSELVLKHMQFDGEKYVDAKTYRFTVGDNELFYKAEGSDELRYAYVTDGSLYRFTVEDGSRYILSKEYAAVRGEPKIPELNPRSGRYELTGDYEGKGYLDLDFKTMTFRGRIGGAGSEQEYEGSLCIQEFGAILYAVDQSRSTMDPVVRDRAWVEEMMNGSCVRFIFKIADSETLNFMYYGTASGQMELGGRTVTDKDRLARTAELPADRSEPALPETDPAESSAPETEPAETQPDDAQSGGTPLINPDTVLGTYTYADGIIRDYIGEWGETRYFVLQIRDSEEEYSFAVGTAPKDREGGPVTLLSYLGRYNAVNYDNVSKMINGTAYVATDRGIFSVSQDGTVERIISGESFRTYPTVGDVLLYSYWVVDGESWTTYLEAYFPGAAGQTVRYLTLENKASQSGGDGFIVTANALMGEGFYYVLAHGETNEIWYQPWRGAEEIATGIPEEAKLIETVKVPGIAYVAGNEHFYFLITEATTHEPKIRLTFLDEPVGSTVVEIGSGWYAPLRAALARTGSWRFTNQYMWFDVNVNKRACTVYQIGEESIMPGWNLLARTPRSEEIILQSEDGSRMLFAQDETDFVDFEADLAENIHVVQARSGEVKEKAWQLSGLSADTEESGSKPVFRLDSESDKTLFLAVFQEDRYPEEGYNEIKGLEQGMSVYDSEFFKDHVLYVIYGNFGPSGLKEEWFRVGCLVKNRVMHLRTGVVVPKDRFLPANMAYYWVFVPVECSRTANVIAWDATPAWQKLPDDRTGAVNADWRNGILDVPTGAGN